VFKSSSPCNYVKYYEKMMLQDSPSARGVHLVKNTQIGLFLSRIESASETTCSSVRWPLGHTHTHTPLSNISICVTQKSSCISVYGIRNYSFSLIFVFIVYLLYLCIIGIHTTDYSTTRKIERKHDCFGVIYGKLKHICFSQLCA